MTTEPLNDSQLLVAMADELSKIAPGTPDYYVAGLLTGFRLASPGEAAALATMDPHEEGGCRSIVREAIALERERCASGLIFGRA
jgi:hypothetical protein